MTIRALDGHTCPGGLVAVAVSCDFSFEDEEHKDSIVGTLTIGRRARLFGTVT